MSNAHPPPRPPLPPDLVDCVRRSERILLTSHSNPDGDAIGSELGTKRLLESLGKHVTIWNRDPTPQIHEQLAGADSIHVGTEPPPSWPDDTDLVIFLECPTPDRSALEELLSGPTVVNIDHHLGNSFYGTHNWVDPAAPAVACMMFDLARELGAPVDEDSANCLFLALVSDTGGFRFSNATERAFTCARDLVAAGASPERVAHILYEQRSEASVRLLAEMLESLELSGNGAVATALLLPGMYERSGATHQDAEGLIDQPRSIAGVEVVGLIRQIDDGEFKISLRSRGLLDVESIARRYSGGGHRNAAGCRMSGTIVQVRAALVRELEELVSKATA